MFFWNFLGKKYHHHSIYPAFRVFYSEAELAVRIGLIGVKIGRVGADMEGISCQIKLEDL